MAKNTSSPQKITKKQLNIAASQSADPVLDGSVSWLEAALEADLKRVEALAQEYNGIASYWRVSSNLSQHVATFYDNVAFMRKKRHCVP